MENILLQTEFAKIEEEAFDELDITNEEVDFDEIEELMGKFNEDPDVQEALNKGIDIRTYAKQVEKELGVVEKMSIDDYIKQTENLVKLHHQIKSCDVILERMECLLNGFQSDLGNISDEIKSLQDQSTNMSIKLQNRKAVASSLTDFITDITVPPILVKNIVNGEVNEKFIEHLKTLNNKIAHSQANKDKKILSANDIEPELEKLKIKAITKIREFLLQHILSLKKPKTNFQIKQSTILLKYKYLNRGFLSKYGGAVANEIRDVYVDTMGRIHFNNCKEYITELMKLNVEIGSKNDLLGAPEAQLKGLFSSKYSKSRMNVFSLGDPSRATLLNDLDPIILSTNYHTLNHSSSQNNININNNNNNNNNADNNGSNNNNNNLTNSNNYALRDEKPYIIVSEAVQAKATFAYECVFKSIHNYFRDAVYSEHYFCLEFFGKIDLFKPLFSKTSLLFIENVTSYCANWFDLIGILICVRIVHYHLQRAKNDKVVNLIEFYETIQATLWNRFSTIFALHLNSLKIADTKTLGSVDIRPHYITRRYAEFTGALHYLNLGLNDQNLVTNLSALQNQMHRLLSRLSQSLNGQRNHIIFFINNIDQILSVFDERGVGGEDLEKWKRIFEDKINKYVEMELMSSFSDMINFVEKFSSENDSNPQINEGATGDIISNFAAKWKNDIEKMNTNVLTNFSNFRTGAQILQQALTLLANYYSKFEEIVKHHFGPSRFKDFVPKPTLTHQIKKYSSPF